MRTVEVLKIEAQDPSQPTQEKLDIQRRALNILLTVPDDKSTEKVVDWPVNEPTIDPSYEDKGKHKVVKFTGTNGKIVRLDPKMNDVHAELVLLKRTIKEAKIRQAQLEIEMIKAIGKNEGGTLANGEASYVNVNVAAPARFQSGSEGKRLYCKKPLPLRK